LGSGGRYRSRPKAVGSGGDLPLRNLQDVACRGAQDGVQALAEAPLLIQIEANGLPTDPGNAVLEPKIIDRRAGDPESMVVLFLPSFRVGLLDVDVPVDQGLQSGVKPRPRRRPSTCRRCRSARATEIAAIQKLLMRAGMVHSLSEATTYRSLLPCWVTPLRLATDDVRELPANMLLPRGPLMPAVRWSYLVEERDGVGAPPGSDLTDAGWPGVRCARPRRAQSVDRTSCLAIRPSPTAPESGLRDAPVSGPTARAP
jgi:hypothetical protein